MDNDDKDKTDEVRERLSEDGTVGGETDSDSGAVLTLDNDSGQDETGREGEGSECEDDGGQ